jgi:hypothetical protein
MPLLLLKLMAQSRRGVIQILEAQVRPLVVAIARFIQLMAPLLTRGRTCASSIRITPRRD